MVKKITSVVNNVVGVIRGPSSSILTAQYLQKLQYESPYFLIDLKKTIASYKEYKKLFPGSHVFFAMKANSEPEVLSVLANEGSGFEVASKYELDILKEIKVSPEKIIYGTSVKPADHIKDFYAYGVRTYAFDSFEELEKISVHAPGSRVYVRVIANDAGSVFKFSEKFGTDTASVIPLLIRARELGLQPYGISFHVGSQASDARAWAGVILSLRSVIQDLLEAGIKLEILNLGGGYPCKYAVGEVPGLKEIAKHTLAQYKKLPYKLNMILEPGRGIVAESAVLVATVIAKVERRGSKWLFLDAGVYNALFETMAYQGSTRYPVTSMRPTGMAGETLFELAGPTGDSPDVISREALLPTDISVGDKLVFHNVGAYSMTVTSSFNGFPKPKVFYK